jgi:hypothetical protein
MLYSLDSIGFDLVTSDPGLKRVTGWAEIGDLFDYNFISPFTGPDRCIRV